MDELKFIQPFMQRAQELAGREPVIAYYCHFYAAKLAIESPVKSPESQAFLTELLDTLEKEKQQLGVNEAVTNDMAGYAHVEAFATRVFLNADNEDRSGQASKKTAKTFLAASIFLELLRVFGDMDPEVAEKIKYAKFKAADIIRALKEGRAPVPGPPGGIPETGPVAGEEGVPPGCEQPFSPPLVEHLSIHPSTSPHHPQPSTTAPSPSHPSPQNYSSTAKTGPSPTVQKPTGTVPTAAHYSGTSSPSELVGESRYDYKVLSQAQRHAKFAISSLQYDDITSAMENLQKAMDLLKPYVE